MLLTRGTKTTCVWILWGFAMQLLWLASDFGNRACAEPPDDKTKALVEKIEANAKEDRQAEVDQQLDKTTMTVEFDAAPFRDVLDFFRDRLKVDIHVARLAKSQMNMPITLRLKNRAVSARTVLDLVFDQLDTPTNYVIRDGVLLITSQDQALVTRIHDCRDLVEAARNVRNSNPNGEKPVETKASESKTGNVKSSPQETPPAQAPVGIPTMQDMTGMQFLASGMGNSDIRSLVDVIQNIVQPQSWTATGGPGSIERYHDRLLIVRQSPQAQQEIKELLNMIRAKEFGPTLQGK